MILVLTADFNSKESWLEWFALAPQAAFVVAGLMCALCIRPRELLLPSVDQARRNWRELLLGHRTKSAQADLTESYLVAGNPGQDTALEAAKAVADSRSRLFAWGVYLVLGGLTLQWVLLVLQQVIEARG